MSESLVLNMEVSNSEDMSADSSSASTILLRGESLSEVETDQFENILYRTAHAELKTELTFVSNVFFQDFLNKMKADFSDGMSPDNASSISKCFTHVRGLRCEIVMDSDSRSVSVTGEGHKLWRECRFLKMAQSLFKQFVENADANSQTDLFVDDTMQSSYSSDSANMGINTAVPQFASTPFPAQPPNSILNADTVSTLLNKIDKMGQEITDLKSTVVTFINTLTPTRLYSDVVSSKAKQAKTQSTQTQKQPTQDVINISDYTASGFDSGTNQQVAAPQKQRKCQLGMNKSAPHKGIPVVISNRPNEAASLSPLNLTPETQHDTTHSYGHNRVSSPAVPRAGNKTLLIGDSILNGVNEKGLHANVHKRSISGATVNTIINELSMYDLNTFNTVIIHCAGNDAANGTDIELLEERYDQLVRLLKCGNPDNRVLLCQVAPRGDANMSCVNECISRLADHWKTHNVQCIAETHDMFYGKDGVPLARFYNQDSIHLSRSGTKRLLGSMNQHIDLVRDFDTCVFLQRAHSGTDRVLHGNRNTRDRRPVSYGRYNQHTTRNSDSRDNQHAPWQTNQVRSRNNDRSRSLKCYYCDMTGHKIADCWNR
ncbi:MAG: SGNH/GDSL hydrolase family protein [Sedimenticola sp.]